LNVVAIDIPPLRDHKEDIPALCELFSRALCRESTKPVTGITPEAMKRLMGLSLAGKCPRAAEHYRARRHLSSARRRGQRWEPHSTSADIYLDDPAARHAFEFNARPARA